MKRLVLAACILLLAFNTLTAQTVLNIVNFGAVGNGSTFNTAAIQRAIDSSSSAKASPALHLAS
jgi:polygalacturonase